MSNLWQHYAPATHNDRAMHPTNLGLSPAICFCNRGGPRPTDDLVAAKRKELEAELQVNGIPVGPDAKTKLYQYYVRAWPIMTPRCLHYSAAVADA